MTAPQDTPQDNTHLDATRMAELMASFAPFESSPHLAVAVSGGSDSLAMALLADQWVRKRGGRITALTVDHGLRPGSGSDAVRVGDWLAGLGIAHEILAWRGRKPATGVQAKARKARYRLLTDWCREACVLHLLLAHQREDQAETFMLRLAAGSGVDGLAAMSGVVETSNVRLLRPLLTVPRTRLRATLKTHGQQWIEDPSNDDPSFARVRIRQSLAVGGAAGVSIPLLAATAARMARARSSLEAEASRRMAVCCRVHPSGYARLDGATLFAAEDDISLRVLARVLMCIGARDHAPRLAKLERLHGCMKTAANDGAGLPGAGAGRWKSATLSRCRVAADQAGVFLVCRERRGLPEPMTIESGHSPDYTIDWDGRFALRLDDQARPLRLGPLGGAGWSALSQTVPQIRTMGVPRVAALTLPALIDDDGIAAVAHLYRRDGMAPTFARAGFHPPQALSAAGFVVAN